MLDNNPPSSPDEKDEPIFDKEKIFDEQVDPLLEKIFEICKQHEIPYLYAFQFSNQPCKECGDHNVQGVCTGGHFPDGYAPDPFHIARRLLDKKHGGMNISTHVVQIDGKTDGLPQPIQDFIKMMKGKLEGGNV